LFQKKTGEYLTFQEQMDLFLTTESDGTVRDLKNFVPRNASSDEILSAAQELEALIHHPKPRSPLQESVQLLGKDLPLFFAASRFGEVFLKKHQSLIQGAQ
jgi:hypothetical protein